RLAAVSFALLLASFFCFHRMPIASAQSGATVASIATSMQPGTWAEVPQNSSIAALWCVATEDCAPHSGNRLGDSIAGAWDSTRLRLNVNGADHGEQGHYIYYDTVTNNWTDTCPDLGDGSPCTGDGQPVNQLLTFSVAGLSVGSGGQSSVPQDSSSAQ